MLIGEKLIVIKIGGNIIDNASNLDGFLKKFASLDAHKILIHGGGKIASRIGEKLGIASKYVDGRRITDEPTLELVTMVYGGLLNKQIVSALQSMDCNAIGLTGADANLIPAHKRPVKVIDYGWAGDIQDDKINIKVLKSFLDNGLTPVFAPLTHNGEGHMLNTNADTIASSLATALSVYFKVQLMYCFEKKGVLYSLEDENDVVKRINRLTFEQMKQDGRLHSGMIPKIENALTAIERGVTQVIIGHADDLLANATDAAVGTIIE